MKFSEELLFFFSALGAFNGLLLSLYIFFALKPRQISNYFLGFLLFVLSIRVGKSVFLYFDWEGLAMIYLQIGLSACFFIGPAMYFYLRSIVAPHKAKILSKWHFGTLLLVTLGVGFIYPSETHPHLWWPYFSNVIYVVWLVYLIAALFPLRKVLKQIKYGNGKDRFRKIWVLSIFIGNAFVWIAYMTAPYTSYIIGALSFTFILYLLVLFLILNRKKTFAVFGKMAKYQDKKIDEAEVQLLSKKLEQLMEDEKVYINPDLKLSDVADKMNILPYTLSQLINDNLGKSFTNFINEHRIAEAKKIIQSNGNLKLEAIGYDCGFNSKSNFYAAFKKITGTTPSKFKNAVS